jgi:hypothetical protein
LEKFLGKIGIYEVYLLLQMDDSILKNILTKIGEVNPKYTLDKQVYNNGKLIQFIDNPSETVQLAVVKKDPYSIRFIQNPSEKVQLEAVKKWSPSIQFIQNPTEKVQLVLVEQDPYSILYIQNPSERVQLIVVKEIPYLIRYIKNPTDKVIQFARSKGYDI